MSTAKAGRGLVGAAFVVALAGCGGGGGGSAGSDLPSGRAVSTPGIESYVTGHNGFNRARVTPGRSSADRAALAAFDDASPADPAGYRDVVEIAEARFRETTEIEVIAEVDPDDGSPTRLLRLTVDQAPFRNRDTAGQAVTEGQFYFRGVGQHLVWASKDGGALLQGVGDLENLVVDFGAETATIHLRTPFDPGRSEIETEIRADDLAFNIRTGAFGGPVTLTSRVDADTELRAEGVLRGYITATPRGLSRLEKTMTTSGLYTVDGVRLSADGVFYGSQPD